VADSHLLVLTLQKYIKVAQVNGSRKDEVNHEKLQLLEEFLRGYSRVVRRFQLEDDVFELLEGTDFPLQNFTGHTFAQQPADKTFPNCKPKNCCESPE
tara:strand:- start:69 stop:362 length:294 start_codon:yes stop_codon:yes gene_type:complete